MALNLTREETKAQIIENLITAMVLLQSEVGNYGEVLDSYDDSTLAKVLVISRELVEAIP